MWTCHQGDLTQTHNETNMKPYIILGTMGLMAILTSCTSTGTASAPVSANGKPLLTRSSHPLMPTTSNGSGTSVGRKYFHPPGFKTGAQWVEYYEQP